MRVTTGAPSRTDRVRRPPDGPLDLLRAAVIVLSRRMRSQQTEGELSPSETAVLGRIGRMQPVTPAALARCEHVQPPSMKRILDRLTSRGLVRRDRDPADQRQVLISRTPDGDELVRKIRQQRTAWLSAQFARLDRADRDLISAAAGALQRLAELT